MEEKGQLSCSISMHYNSGIKLHPTLSLHDSTLSKHPIIPPPSLSPSLPPSVPLLSSLSALHLRCLFNSDHFHENTFMLHLIGMSGEFAFKILLVGKLGVGKSSLLLRYAEGSFREGFLPAVGVDFKIRTVQHAGSDLHLQLWDNATEHPLPTACYRRANGLMVVFDLTDRQSFLEVRGWLEDARKRGSCDAVRVLVGNKCDLPGRTVERTEGEALAVNEEMAYFEVSARENINVEEVFSSLAGEMKQRFSSAYIAKYKLTQSYLLPLTGPSKTRSSCF